jgi:hypothetical protein
MSYTTPDGVVYGAAGFHVTIREPRVANRRWFPETDDTWGDPNWRTDDEG